MSEMEEQDNPQAPIEPHPQPKPHLRRKPSLRPKPSRPLKPSRRPKPGRVLRASPRAGPRKAAKPGRRARNAAPVLHRVVAPARVRRAKGRRVSIAAPSGVPSAAPIAAHAPIAVVRAPTSPPKSTSTN
jgi:hypothetical protein